MRVALDSNVLIYAEIEPETTKGRRAAEVTAAAARAGVLAAQAIGEYLWVVRRRQPHLAARARAQAESFRDLFTVVPSDLDVLLDAARFAERYRLQYWDSVIWQASRRGGAAILLSEDLQDGFSAEGMRVVDPFAAEPSPALRALLAR